MKSEDVLRYAISIRDSLSNRDTVTFTSGRLSGDIARVTEFLKNFAGPGSSFFREAAKTTGSDKMIQNSPISILNGFIAYVEAGLHSQISPERKAQLDTVSDFLDQANTLIETKDVHPAAPAVLIGATLEEFLRSWVETEGLSLGNRKPTLQNYADVLKEKDLITKQDLKDITAWGGVRNSAAHGEWDAVSDKARIRLMLEGVNLFMRKYGI